MVAVQLGWPVTKLLRGVFTEPFAASDGAGIVGRLGQCLRLARGCGLAGAPPEGARTHPRQRGLDAANGPLLTGLRSESGTRHNYLPDWSKGFKEG